MSQMTITIADLSKLIADTANTNGWCGDVREYVDAFNQSLSTEMGYERADQVSVTRYRTQRIMRITTTVEVPIETGLVWAPGAERPEVPPMPARSKLDVIGYAIRALRNSDDVISVVWEDSGMIRLAEEGAE